MNAIENNIPPGAGQTITSRPPRNPWALGGVFFAAFFLAGGVLGGALASGSLPLPGAPATEVVGYYTDNGTATLVLGACQVLSAMSLFIFVAPVATFLRGIAAERRGLRRLATGGGALAASFLLASALLAWVLALTAAGSGLDLVATLRSLNFLTGGVAHVVSLGLFVGATSAAAWTAKALPRGIRWLGIVAAAPAILSLASLVWFPASILLPVGRLLCLVWSIAASLALALGSRRDTGAAG